MNYIYHGKDGWILQPTRKVEAFESGLCRIEEEYICSNKNIDYNYFQAGNLIDDSSPCIDGAYIFKAPKYDNMGNGFTKASITSYGRTSQSGSVDSVSFPSTLEFYIFEAFYSTQYINYTDFIEIKIGSVPVVKSIPIIKKVLPKNSFPPSKIPDGTFGIFDEEGNDIAERIFSPSSFENVYQLNPSNYHGNFAGVKLNNQFEVSRFDSVNFGNFNEITMQYIDSTGKQYMPTNTFNSNAIPQPGNANYFYKKQSPTFKNLSYSITGKYFDFIDSGGGYLLKAETLTDLELNNAKQLELVVKDQGSNIIYSNTYDGVGFTQYFAALSNGTYTISVKSINDYGSNIHDEEWTIPLV